MVFYFWCFQAWTYRIIIVYSSNISKGFIHLTPKLPLIYRVKGTKPFLKAKNSRFSLRNWSLFKFLINHHDIDYMILSRQIEKKDVSSKIRWDSVWEYENQFEFENSFWVRTFSLSSKISMKFAWWKNRLYSK